MIAFLSFLIFLLILWVILYFAGKRVITDYKIVPFNRNYSELIKGYAILLVVLGHVGQYLGINGIEYPAGVGVSLFLIVSGYGISKSEQNNGLKNFWNKKLTKIWIPYFIVEISSMFVSRSMYSPEKVLLDFLLIMPKHPFGWYLRFIVVCYLIFYLSWKVFKSLKMRFGCLLVLFIVWFMIRSTIWIDSTPFLQARQILAFPIGVCIANMPNEFLKKWGGHWNCIGSICFIMVGTGIYGFLHLEIITTNTLILYNAISLFTCTVCAMGVIILIDVWKLLQNSGIKYVATVSYELYLVHGYTCCLLGNGYVALGEFILFTIAGAIVLHYIVIWNRQILRKLARR